MNEIFKKNNLNKNIKIDFGIDDNQINKLLDEIKIFGQIIINEESKKNYELYNNFLINTKNIFHKLKYHTNSVYCLTVMNDGRLVSGSADCSIIIYNKISYNPDLIIKEHKGYICCIIQLRSGILASCSSDNTVKLFNINGIKYEVLQTLNYHTNYVWKIIELKDKSLVTCSSDSSIIFYMKDSLKYTKDYSISTDSECYSIIQTKYNEICYSVLKNNKICFYNLLYKKTINSISNLSKYNGIRFWPILMNKDLLIVPGENRISIVDLKEYKLVRIIQVPGSSWIYGICLLNNNMLLTSDNKEVIRQWKIEGDNLLLISKKEKAHKSQINVLLNLGDGHIASGSDCTIRIW